MKRALLKAAIKKYKKLTTNTGELAKSKKKVENFVQKAEGVQERAKEMKKRIHARGVERYGSEDAYQKALKERRRHEVGELEDTVRKYRKMRGKDYVPKTKRKIGNYTEEQRRRFLKNQRTRSAIRRIRKRKEKGI